MPRKQPTFLQLSDRNKVVRCWTALKTTGISEGNSRSRMGDKGDRQWLGNRVFSTARSA